MKKRIATIVLGAASLALGAACGADGDGGTSTQHAVVGGKPVVTKSGQHVQALKLLEAPSGTSTLGKFTPALSCGVLPDCKDDARGARATRGRSAELGE
jgi:hypothetical protein